MKDKLCIVVMGPTAVGKTDYACALAKHYNTSIISADSRQCYKELNAGVSKPGIDQLQEVIHYFINSHSIQENVNANVFEEYALEKIQKVFEQNDVAVMVGGTGLYIKAFCDGLDPIPVVDPEIRNKLLTSYNEYGIAWLQQELHHIDPMYYANGELKNPHRMLRALEVRISTGRSVSDYHSREKKQRSFSIKKIGLTLPREDLYIRIDKRVDCMIETGLLEEAVSLYPYHALNALQTVGYRELFEHLDKKISLEEAIKKIKTNTHRYAKRQMTWFRKDEEIQWLDARSEFKPHSQ